MNDVENFVKEREIKEEIKKDKVDVKEFKKEIEKKTLQVFKVLFKQSNSNKDLGKTLKKIKMEWLLNRIKNDPNLSLDVLNVMSYYCDNSPELSKSKKKKKIFLSNLIKKVEEIETDSEIVNCILMTVKEMIHCKSHFRNLKKNLKMFFIALKNEITLCDSNFRNYHKKNKKIRQNKQKLEKFGKNKEKKERKNLCKDVVMEIVEDFYHKHGNVLCVVKRVVQNVLN